MIQYDKLWRAYTIDKYEAEQYRVKDRQINYHALKNGYQAPVKYIKLYAETKTSTGKVYVLPVSQHRVQQEYRLSEYINFDMGDWKLYDYQQKAVDFVAWCVKRGDKSALIVSSMGTGKTLVMAWLLNLFKLKTIIIVPSLVIAKGVYDTLKPCCNCEVVKSSTKGLENFDVIITTMASFNKMYDRVNGVFDVVVNDEQHHLPEARVAQFNKWKWRFIVWLTATPERKEYGIDGFQMMFGNIHDTKITALPVRVIKYDYKYNYSAKEFIEAGKWLPPDSPEMYRRLYGKNLDRVSKLSGIIQTFQWRWFKRFIVFVDRLDHVDVLKENLKNKSPIIVMTGKENKEQIVDMLREMDDYIIIGMNQCTWEWFDVKPLEVGILFTSTSRNNTVMQTAGRMVRKDWVKTHWYFVDFVDHIQISWSKPKVMWYYERSKVYKKNGWDVLSFNYM